MSDGKIQRICSCAMQRVGSDRLSEADRSILVDVIKARSPKKEAEIRYRALSATWNAALGSCKAAG
ncbi:MAG: hypothetical protein EXQ95_12215 [Alphaproteobacteria bacterium]|nr:hypothetical protein [Alphaproteobacteria bacterium]